MKKLHVILLLLSALLTLPYSVISADVAGGCPGCTPQKYRGVSNNESEGAERGEQQKRGDKQKLHCFNCDQRPCVATKEAWIRLWEKYWGAKGTDGTESVSSTEDKK